MNKIILKFSRRKGTASVAVIALAALSILIISQTSSAQLTFQGKGCSGNSICDVIRSCDASGCTSRYENCQACPSTTKTCPSGPLRVPGVCVDSGTPQCRDVSASATCPSGPPPGVNPGEPYTTLMFTVFTKKNLVINITPTTHTALAGKTVDYKIGVENKNPKQLTFQISYVIPSNWQISIPQSVPVAAGGKAEVPFRVTSNQTASDASYPITIGLFNSELSLFGTATAEYVVASRGPPSISTNPKSQAGYPGQQLFYNVSVTNNDPVEFDPSTINLRATVPDGFNAVFTPNSISVAPQATAYVRLDVTSPTNATEATYGITLNATANRLTAAEFIEYKIDFCGDSICEQGEEGSCLKDCPADSSFSCNGRCELEVDDGLEFSASINVPYNKFIVCNRNSSLQACVQAAGRTTVSIFPGINSTNTTANCGIGSPCLCTSNQPDCKTLCVDAKGVYYLAASTGNSSVRGLVNWSYACPFVDLPEIKALRNSFENARNEYEKAQSALKESLSGPNVTLQKRSEIQPCIDALSGIIADTRGFVAYLDAVIAWPGKMNTTAAKARVATVRTSIESTYNTYCRGASGLLQIALSAPQLEKGQTGQMTATVSNIGNTPYYGYVQCDFTGAAGERSSQNSSCASISGPTSFGLDVNASSAGKWSARCKAYGSLLSNCSLSAVHSEASLQFNVSTRETFVVDVTGSCQAQNASASSLICSVRGSQNNCVGCRSGPQGSQGASVSECILVTAANGTNGTNGTSRFSCTRPQYGNVTLFGYVLDNDRCKPVPPVEKNISVRCAGCGDGVVDSGEQCETPYSNNNAKCSQQQNICQGKLFGIRDATGFCTADCACSYDQYEFSCTRGQCGAECQDGETRQVSINKTSGSCLCTQQCGSGCTWNPCDCEPSAGGGGGAGGGVIAFTSPPTVQVSHSPQSPTSAGTVTITATAINATEIEIYVDGFIVRTCSASPCPLTASYTPGAHNYFGRAVNPVGVDTDPDQGTKSFTIPMPAAAAGQNQTSQQNQTTTTNNSTSLTLSHSPQNPTTLDSVMITASASVNANRIDIFVDGFLAKSCSEFVCALSARYSAGGHTYFALAFDSRGNSVANPLTGTKTFTVTQAAANVTGMNGTAGGPGTVNIVLDVNHNPQSITTTDAVTLTAIAHGPHSFREMNIFADGSLKKTCTNVPSSQPCTFRSTFPEGSHEYYATATDVANNSVSDPGSGTKGFTVSAASQPAAEPPPGGPFIGSGQGATTTTSGLGRCYVSITGRNCTYNAATRRYDLKLAAIWDNGTHVHWEVDGSQGPKMYTKNFTHVEPLSAPGMKSVKALVHNVNDSLLCMDSSEVYCGPGSTSGKDLDLIIVVNDVVKTGFVDVRVIAAPYIDITPFRLMNYIESRANVSNVRLEGNSSMASVSGPVRVAEDKTYILYTANTNLMTGKNISVLYKLRIDEPGEYKLMAVANYSTVQRVTKTIKATNCPQAFGVFAVSPNGLCLPYTTPCDVPTGWSIVERCPEETPKQESSILPLLILIVVIVVLALLLYRKRDTIRERLSAIRRRPQEELPRFEEE